MRRARKITIEEYDITINPMTTAQYWKSVVDKEDTIRWARNKEVREFPKCDKVNTIKSVGIWNFIRFNVYKGVMALRP